MEQLYIYDRILERWYECMKKRISMLIGGVILLSGMIGNKAMAVSQNAVWNSQGEIIFDNDTQDVSDDVVFDTKDMNSLLYNTGEETLFSSRGKIIFDNNTVDKTDDVIFDAADFERIETKLSVIPNIYYFDRMMEGEVCNRYVLLDGEYYLCDVNGKKMEEEPLSSRFEIISVVDKNYEVEPVEGEIQLVLYESANEGSLSAGTAGFVDKKLVLGSGKDNIDNKNKGIIYADSRVNEKSKSYEAGYSSGYEKGYKEGYKEGEAAGYEKGYKEGEAAGYEKGYKEGETAGYEKGYKEGKTAGFKEGENAGYKKGETAGYEKGYKEGEAAGYKKGETAGYKKGYAAGKEAGYKEGYDIGYQQGIEFADGCVNESSASYIAGYEKGKQAVKNSIYSFAGRELVANETQYSQIVDKVILGKIDPSLFSQIRFLSTWWYGSGSGNYPDCEAYGENVIWIEDTVTGEILQTSSCGVRGGSYNTFDISGYTNPVRLKASITWQKGNWGDACGEGWISSVYLKVREA